MEHLTAANEDYLEAIVELAGSGAGAVRSVDVATKLGVSKASVNKAVGALKDAGYVTQASYGTIGLTPEGEAYGSGVLERHHLLSNFLIEALGVADEVAEEEACKMEHAISDDTLERLRAYLLKQGVTSCARRA